MIKKREIYTLFMIFLFTISYTLVVSGFSVLDFFIKTSQEIESVTGFIGYGSTGVNVTLTSRPSNIYLVENATCTNCTGRVTITENSFTNITVSFYVNDPDGADSVKSDQARLNITRSLVGGTGGSLGSPISNFSSPTSGGCFDSGNINGTVANISCTAHIWYFLSAGNWNITVAYYEDNGSFSAQNRSHNFTLASTTAIQISPSNMTFPTTSAGSFNVTSNNDPIQVNNTGNVAAASGNVRINATDLFGETVLTEFIPATNFSAAPINSTYSGSDNGECRAHGYGNVTNLTNSTAAGIENSILAIGNHSIQNGTSGQEHIYLCFVHVPIGISAQSYSSLIRGPSWIVDVA